VLPQGIEQRGCLPKVPAGGGFALYCAFDANEFYMVYPATYTRNHTLHAVIYIAGPDGNAVVFQQKKKQKPLAPRVQQLISEFAWIFVVGSAQRKSRKWRESPNPWILGLTDTMSKCFDSLALVGFSRGAWWASKIAAMKPQAFRCVILLGGYPSPGANAVQQQEEAAALFAAVDEVMVVASKGGRQCPTETMQAWPQIFQSHNAKVVLHDAWNHGDLYTKFVEGDVLEDAAAQETLERMHAMLHPKAAPARGMQHVSVGSHQ